MAVKSSNISYICPKCGHASSTIRLTSGEFLSTLCVACTEAAIEILGDRAAFAAFKDARFTKMLSVNAWEFQFSASKADFEADNLRAWADARSYAANLNSKPYRRNLFFVGPPGVGKTWIARCILIDALRRGHTVAECSAIALVQGMIRWSEEGLAKERIRAKLLLIDDLDKMDRSEKALGALWNVLDARATAGRATMITSNLTQEALIESWADIAPHNSSLVTATLERLIPCDEVIMGGPSLRRKAASERGQNA